MLNTKKRARVIEVVQDDHQMSSSRILFIKVVCSESGQEMNVDWAKSDTYIPWKCSKFYIESSKAFEKVWNHLKVGDEVFVISNPEENFSYVELIQD